ncbi:site-specific integrase [Opitutales bacterium]|nr:site-specific integrase [Opitutales bacterium]
MPRTTKLKPVKVGDGKWRLNIPAEYSNTGKRRRMLFPSEAKAEAEVRRLKGHVSKHGSASTRFTNEESTDARAALSMLKDSNLKEDHDLTLKAAVKHYLEHLHEAETSVTVAEVFKASLRERTEDRGRKWSTQHEQETRAVMLGPLPNTRASEDRRETKKGFLYHFGERSVDSVGKDEILRFIRKYYGSSDYNFNRALRTIKPIFQYAQKKGWARVSPTAEIYARDAYTETEVLKIEEFNLASELMQTDKFRDISAGIAILMWAGLRPSELMGNNDKPPLLWEDIYLNPQGAHTKPYIDVKDVNAKGSDGRLVEIEPNLVSWLEDVPKEKREGPVLAGRGYKEFRKALGVTGKHDIFRHSYATYHFHHFKSIDQTMVQLGHTNRKTFEKHYKRYNPEEDSAFLYWQIVPEGAC